MKPGGNGVPGGAVGSGGGEPEKNRPFDIFHLGNEEIMVGGKSERCVEKMTLNWTSFPVTAPSQPDLTEMPFNTELDAVKDGLRATGPTTSSSPVPT